MRDKVGAPSLADEVLVWVEPFAASKRNARADLPGVTDQRRDYRQKIAAIARDFESTFNRPMLLADLFGPVPDQLLRARRDGRTGAPLRAASRNAYRRVLNSLVNWLHRRGLAGAESTPWSMEPEGKRTLRTFEPEDIERIFEHLVARDTIPNRRLAAIIGQTLDYGARRGDALSLRLSTLDLTRGRATLWVKHDKEHPVPLGPLAVAALRRYLAVRNDPYGHDLVFLNDVGDPISGDAVTRAFRRVLLNLGLVSAAKERTVGGVPAVPERLNLQAVRRTFVKEYLAAGRSERHLAAIMGWHPDYAHRTVEAYAEVTIEELEAVHPASSPLTRLLRRDAA